MDKKNVSLSKFIGGVMFCLSSIILVLFENDIPVPVKITLAIVGIVLITRSKYRLIK